VALGVQLSNHGTKLARNKKTLFMKGLLITLGVVAVAAGTIYYFRDNENVKNALDKVKDTANDTMGKINDTWKKTAGKANNVMAEQA
jgi:hypothetical protein